MPGITIVETKEIIRLVKDKFDFDLSPLILISLRLKLDSIIQQSKLRNFEHLYESINGDPRFFDYFLYEIFYSSAEIFRDPGMWIILKEEIIPSLMERTEKIDILIPQCSCGSDLYSTLILLEEMNLTGQADIHLTWITERNKKNISEGKIEKNLNEASAKNIREVFPDCPSEKYIILKNKEYFFNTRFLKNISFSKHDYTDRKEKKSYHLILCRNKFLFFNLNYQNLMLEKLVRELRPGGILVTGYKEDISDYMTKNNFLTEVNSSEKIYGKKTSVNE